MADIEQMKKIIPFVTCEITFGQNFCELMFGINESKLNFRIKVCRDNPHNSSFSLLTSPCVSVVCCSQSVVLVPVCQVR